MATRHVSLRLDADIFDRLESRSRQTGQSRSQLVNTLLEEGLRMEVHPGIVFRSGPAGRRAGLAAGPDIWEVARVLKGTDARGEEAIRRAATLMGLTPDQVRTALHYYVDYQDEIDDWMQRVDEEAERAEDAWRRERELLGA